MYLIKSNVCFKLLYPHRLWKMPVGQEKVIYITFDDGPHPVATRFALDTLKTFNAKASFFCIGKNIEANPALFEETSLAGHTIGNHTFNHLNGWKTSVTEYIADIEKTRALVGSPLFRPPYGRMSKAQQRALLAKFPDTQIVMWDLLSGDFDINIQPEKCWDNVRRNCNSGSILVFHDSTKAFDRMQYALPKTLEYFSARGYSFKSLPVGSR